MSLFVDTVAKYFGSGQFTAMSAYAQHVDANTSIIDVNTVDQLLVSKDGGVGGDGYRFTSSVFRKLCGLLCPGSAALILELAGLRRVNTLPSSCYSIEAAIRIFNDIMRTRFDHVVSGYQLLLNKAERTIDSLIGPQYRILSNADFLGDIEGNTSAVGLEFGYGCLIGRWLCARFVKPTPLISVDLADGRSDDYHAGVGFISSELGDSTVRATHGIVRRSGTEDLWALCPYTKSSSLRHRGRHFGRALTKLMTSVVEKKTDPTWLSSRLADMEGSLMGFGKTEDADDRLFRQLVSLMRLLRLDESHARYILRSALMQGRTGVSHPDLRRSRKEVWPTRTTYDLFVSAMRAAKKYSPLVGEKIELSAFRMLGGRSALRHLSSMMVS